MVGWVGGGGVSELGSSKYRDARVKRGGRVRGVTLQRVSWDLPSPTRVGGHSNNLG